MLVKTFSSSFTRPADTTAYASGDMMANSTTHNEVLLAQIAALEATMTPRRIREAIKDPTWMNELETKIAALRTQLTKE